MPSDFPGPRIKLITEILHVAQSLATSPLLIAAHRFAARNILDYAIALSTQTSSREDLEAEVMAMRDMARSLPEGASEDPELAVALKQLKAATEKLADEVGGSAAGA